MSDVNLTPESVSSSPLVVNVEFVSKYVGGSRCGRFGWWLCFVQVVV